MSGLFYISLISMINSTNIAPFFGEWQVATENFVDVAIFWYTERRRHLVLQQLIAELAFVAFNV